LLGRWEHSFSATSQLSLQSYFDRTVLGDLRLSEARNTGDIEIEHRFKLGAAQQIVWGAGYRASYDSIGPSRTISMTPAAQTFQLWNGFAQDTIGLVPNLLSFTFGSKIEHDSYTGFQVEPDARLLWTPTPAQSVWAAVSRAVRTPSRAEEDVSIFEEVAPPNTPGNPSSLPVEVIANGNNALKAESLISYELGYRVQPFSTLSLDLTGFYNDYTNVIGSQLGTSQGPLGTYPDLYLIQPINLVNDGHMRSYGFEMLATWQAAPWWRVQPSYSYLQMQMKVANGDTAEEPVGTSPVSQAGIRSLIDLGSNVTFDGFLRYVDQLPALGVASYVELNARLGWRVSDRLELSLSGENLLHAYHTEFGSETLPIIPTKVPRSVFAKATFKF
jgi:iron complex outermembrane recepter protein